MQYKVVPFDPVSRRLANSAVVAAELEQLIEQHAADGWHYVGLESISAIMPGTSGCFGMGAEPPSNIFYGLAVFRR